MRQTGAGSTSQDLLDGNYELMISEGKLKVFWLEGSEKQEMTVSGTFLIRRMIGYQIEDTHYLRFPLYLGQLWKGEYSRQGFGPGGKPQRITRHFENKVTGIEEITSPMKPL